MKVLVVRSIPLSPETMEAWKSTNYDVKFANRNRAVPNDIVEIFENEEYGYDLVLNLGNSQMLQEEFVVTCGEAVEMLSSSKVLRNSILGGYMPPKPIFGDAAWAKKGGYGGRGKEFVGGFNPDVHNIPDYDYQRHIDGTEYRVITVGEKVVQVQERVDDNPFDPADRKYEWIGVKNAPKGVKGLARECAKSLPGYNVIGWDIISNPGGVYLLEGNTCPGVNNATAQRVLDEIAKHFGLYPEEPVVDVVIEDIALKYKPFDIEKEEFTFYLTYIQKAFDKAMEEVIAAWTKEKVNAVV